MKTCLPSVLFSVLLITTDFLPAQNALLLVGGSMGLPSRNHLQTVAGTAFGGSLQLEKSMGKHTYALLSIEYLSFAKKSTLQSSTKFSVFPVQVGIKYYSSSKEVTAQGLILLA